MSSPEHILVVDDDAEVRKVVQRDLEKQGYRVSVATNGQSMRGCLPNNDIALVLLDLVMPGEDGLELTRYLRNNYPVGIIILTGRGDTVDRVVGLEMGADDYLAKPFELRELLARIRSVLRRTKAEAAAAVVGQQDIVSFGGWELNLGTQALTAPDKSDVALTAAEFSLLAALVRSPTRVLSRDTLLDLVKTGEAIAFDRSIDVHVFRLRQKLEADPKKPVFIKTVRGAGYIFGAALEKRPS